MHELTFADSAGPTPVICLRLPLLNYSLGHELTLLQRRNEFLCLSRLQFDALTPAQQVSALVKGVLVCYRPFAHQAKPERWLGLWRWMNRHTDYPLAIAEFRNYLAAGRNLMPTLSSSDERDKETYEIANAGDKMSAGRPTGSPMIAQLIHFCIAELGMTPAQAMDAPFGYIGNLYFAQLEGKGALYVENLHETATRAEMAEKRAEVKSETEQAADAWRDACGKDKGQSETARRAAYEKFPRIGNLFAAEWYAAATDAAKAAVETKWDFVAAAELARASLPSKKAPVCPD